jgi:hypothetical protein
MIERRDRLVGQARSADSPGDCVGIAVETAQLPSTV